MGQKRTTFIPPSIPEEWDYDESVGRVKGFVYKAKNLTDEIRRELYIAREILSTPPNERARSSSGTFVPMEKTWDDYCQDIGVERGAANRWLVPKKPVHVLQNAGDTEWDTPPEIINPTSPPFFFFPKLSILRESHVK